MAARRALDAETLVRPQFPEPKLKNQKKNAQLGMDAGTASQRLVKDLLFKFVIDAGHHCHHCGKAMTRETFSIDHKDAWLDSPNPIEAFFDLDNIAFSHKSCNYRAARRDWKKYHTDEQRLEARRRQDRERQAKNYCPIRRREKYRLTGR